MNGDRYSKAQTLFEKNGHKVFVPDLPGFGNNTLEKEELFFDDYVDFVKDFIKKRKLTRVILLGHSFGGRVAITFTAVYPQYVTCLVLTGASGVPRPLPSLKKKAVHVATKIIKPLFTIPPLSLFYAFFRKLVYYSIGEMDYYKANKLSKTFKNVYQVSIVGDLEKIVVPTLIVWGEKDTFTPLADGKLMHERIKKSKLVVVKNASHKLPYENPKEFTKIVINFLQSI